ncbi:MAG: glycoside hydrolase family 3 C-terminal domain-containing protein, partial [Microlunatus sp.]
PGFNAASPRYDKLPGDLNAQISVRWTGSLVVPTSGSYRFSLTSLGSYAFSLDGKVVAASGNLAAVAAAETGSDESAEPVPYGWGGSAAEDPTVDELTVELEAGKEYPIRLDYAANHPSQGFLLGARIRLGWVPPAGVYSPEVIEAAELAAASDLAVVVVRTYEAEADDRPHLGLPSGQDDLIKAVLAANPRTVVVLMTGAPVDVTRWGGRPAALLQAWFPGQAQGEALARVLTGQVEPGGRLPLTIPLSLEDTPAADPRSYPGVDGQVHYDEGVFVGYRGITETGPAPAYPFGHGLGYTTFDFSNLAVEAVDGDNAAEVSVTVTNTGDREGSEVVQVYVGELPAPVPTPARQLAAFAKVKLAPGESERVTVSIPRRAVSYFDVESHDWATPAGEVAVLVGASSADIRASGSIVV